ncbi:metallophosphoesterase [Blastopirellula retiformator]|uniref:Calcineurin-like phosphoesterase n=1 Tax=Blastopirellula retiformator TaxID=2527970 RepID=A0A5C5VPP8_9BACT|nr:metallophosphoesterase [Blastopirellula retiformator]TWT39679.1 Calcineurin-like phosphoesterase [Blastopirellula retiformator]
MTSLDRRQLLKTGASLAVGSSFISLAGSQSLAADPYADAKFVEGEPAPIGKGSFTVAVLPDTQMYGEGHPEGFLQQTKWLAENKKSRNIAAALHLGDITNRNTAEQWQLAASALAQLDGKIPYFLVPGNHDYSSGGKCHDRSTSLNDYFPIDKFRPLPTFGGVYDKEPRQMENSYHLFSAGGRDFVVIGLEFGPRRDVVRWANEIAAKHKDREAILITHAYMYFDETRYDWAEKQTKQTWNPHSYQVAKISGGDVMDGTELWNNLVSKHENFILTVNGHVLNDGLARMTSTTPGGRDVHQMLVNFQMKPNGGDAWLRLLEFTTDGSVNVVDYSPTRNQVNASPQNQFSLKLAKV